VTVGGVAAVAVSLIHGCALQAVIDPKGFDVKQHFAYAKALEKLTGVDVGKLLPIPDISNKRFPEAKKHQDSGLHGILYQFSPNDYTEGNQIWNGVHPEDGSELSVQRACNAGATPPDLDEEPQLTAPLGPDIDQQMFEDVAAKLGDDVKRRSTRKRANTAASRPRR
jgi:hypothetical protein